MIEGVRIIPLRQFWDERGKVMHMLKCDRPEFQSFGEVYFSTVYPGVIKGWHIHHRMVLNYAVPLGHIKLVLYDNREESMTRGEIQEIFLGPDNYNLVTIPVMVWNGIKSIGMETALIANCATIPHDPDEIERLDPFDPQIPYDWSI